MEMHLRRIAIALALSCAASATGHAANATTLAGVDVVRELLDSSSGLPLDPGLLLPGTSVDVRLTVTDARGTGPAVEGFYLSESVPEGLSPSNDTIDAAPTTPEVTLTGAIHGGCVTRRWVLDEPPAFGGTTLSPGSTLVIAYSVTIPASAGHGQVFSLPGFSWVGILDATDPPTAVEHYGYEGDATFAGTALVAVLDDGDADGLPLADELSYGCDPFSPDTDGDGVSDGAEVAAGTDPTVPDAPSSGGSGLSCNGGSDPGAPAALAALCLALVALSRANATRDRIS